MSFKAISKRFVRVFEIRYNKYWPQFSGSRYTTFRVIGTRDGVIIAQNTETRAEIEFCLL